MKKAAKDKISTPMAPMVLNTFAVPTPAIQAGMAKTNIVLKVLRTNVSPVSASPMISVIVLEGCDSAQYGPEAYRYMHQAYKSKQGSVMVLSQSCKYHMLQQLEPKRRHCSRRSRTCVICEISYLKNLIM